MDLAVTEADRTKALFEAGSVSQAAWDKARSQAERARAQYDVVVLRSCPCRPGEVEEWRTGRGASEVAADFGPDVALVPRFRRGPPASVFQFRFLRIDGEDATRRTEQLPA